MEGKGDGEHHCAGRFSRLVEDAPTRAWVPADPARQEDEVDGVASARPETREGPGAGASLSQPELLRYGRHLLLPEVGMEGQLRLKSARVLLVGAGGLGSPAALYLAAAGVGTLGIVDFDRVDASNLHRQILHGTSDVGRGKLDSARDRLREVNPLVEVVLHEVRLDSSNAMEILGRYDLVVDGSDNFPTRYLVNDACVLLGIPDIYGAIHRFEGQVSVFHGAEGPCYRCLFREPPPPGLIPSCAEAGVLGVLPGIVGSLQAMEAIKWILGIGKPLIGRLQIFEGLEMEWRELGLRKDPRCPVCSEHPTLTELIDYERFCGIEPGEATGDGDAISPVELDQRLAGEAPPAVLDVREPHEWALANLRDRGALHIPLGELSGRLSELDPGREWVVHCRSGARSARAQELLQASGYPRVLNLEGGILAWRDQVDPSLPES
jgi:sulfur-carrier protein adenylyltransferase/sulfurtransferase